MASKPLRFHPQAEQEYLTALSWYRERSPIAAINFESAFGQAVEKISEAPQRWPIYFLDFRQTSLLSVLSVRSEPQALKRDTLATTYGTAERPALCFRVVRKRFTLARIASATSRRGGSWSR
jgi:hypothetical protein